MSCTNSAAVQAVQLLDRRSAEVGRGVKLVENPREQVEVVPHHDDGGLDLFDAAAVRLRVLRERLVHLLFDADVVDDESLLLVLKFPVHPRDRLDQVVPLDRLVDVDGIEERHVEACQPHVHHDGDFEIGFRLLELGIELLALVLVAEQIVERLLVVLAPRHHHLDISGGFCGDVNHNSQNHSVAKSSASNSACLRMFSVAIFSMSGG